MHRTHTHTPCRLLAAALGLSAALLSGCVNETAFFTWQLEDRPDTETNAVGSVELPTGEYDPPEGPPWAVAPLPEEFVSDATGVTLTLRDALRLALSGNHDIRVSSHGPEISRAEAEEAHAVYDPEVFAQSAFGRDDDRYSGATGDITRRADTMTEQIGLRQRLPTGAQWSLHEEWYNGRETGGGLSRTRQSDNAHVLEVSQPLLRGRGDRENRDTIRIAKLRVEQSDEELRLAVIDALLRVTEAYWRLAQAGEDVRTGRETLAMAREVLKQETERADGGVTMRLDVERAREAVATRTADYLRICEQFEVAQEQLKLALNAPRARPGSSTPFSPTTPLATDTPPIDATAALQTALERRVEILVARLGVSTGEVRKGFARHSMLPQLDVQARLRANERGAGGGSGLGGNSRDATGADWQMGVAFSMPLGNDRARAMVRRAEAEGRRAGDELARTQDQVAAEVRVAVRSVELTARELPAAERSVRAAREVIEGDRARLELNRNGNQDLLRAHDLLSTAERNLAATRVRHRMALITLEKAQGTLLDSLGVSLATFPDSRQR